MSTVTPIPPDFHARIETLDPQHKNRAPFKDVAPVSPRTKLSAESKFLRLFSGDYEGITPSASEAVQFVLCHLARKHANDAALMREDFEHSGLYKRHWKDKWQRLVDSEIGKAISSNPKPKARNYEGDGSDWREHFENGEQMGDKPLKFIAENFWVDESMCVISGLVGHGKTWAALDISRSLWKGISIFGHFPVPEAIPVLYLTPEVGRAALKHRMKLYELHTAGDFFLTRTLSQGPTLGLGDPRVICAAKGRVVVLDTIHRFTEGDENASSDANRFGDLCLNLIAQGCRGILGLGHAAKAFASADTMTAENCLRGSSEFGGIIGSMFAFKRLDEELLKIHVECVKPRDFEGPKPFQLQGRPHISEGGGYIMTATPGECGYLRDAQKDTQARIHPKREAICQMLGEGRPSRDITEKLHVSSKTVTAVRQSWKTNHGNEGADPQTALPKIGDESALSMRDVRDATFQGNGEGRPPEYCYVHGAHDNFWRRPNGGWVCGKCNPPRGTGPTPSGSSGSGSGRAAEAVFGPQGWEH
jgi:hypothetical protein